MKVIDPGHTYQLNSYDGETDIIVSFLHRVGPKYPGNQGSPYPGTNCQEVIRVLINRVKYLHSQNPHIQNHIIINALRNALLGFEVRAAEKHGRVLRYYSTPIEDQPHCYQCGHLQCEHIER